MPFPRSWTYSYSWRSTHTNMPIDRAGKPSTPPRKLHPGRPSLDRRASDEGASEKGRRGLKGPGAARAKASAGNTVRGAAVYAAPRFPGPSWPVADAHCLAFGPTRGELDAHPRVVVYWPHVPPARGPAPPSRRSTPRCSSGPAPDRPPPPPGPGTVTGWRPLARRRCTKGARKLPAEKDSMTLLPRAGLLSTVCSNESLGGGVSARRVSLMIDVHNGRSGGIAGTDGDEFQFR